MHASPYPQRFDYQGTLDATAWLAAPVALQALERQVGWDRLRAHSAAMVSWGAERIAERLRELTGIGEVVVPAMAVDTMRLIRLPDHVASTREAADARRDRMIDRYAAELAVTAFDGIPYLRLSAHGYSTADDILSFCDGPLPELIA